MPSGSLRRRFMRSGRGMPFQADPAGGTVFHADDGALCLPCLRRMYPRLPAEGYQDNKLIKDQPEPNRDSYCLRSDIKFKLTAPNKSRAFKRGETPSSSFFNTGGWIFSGGKT